MKNKIIFALVVLGAALAHILPVIGIFMIMTTNEVARALGTAILFFSTVALGYMHGWNRTKLTF